MPARIQLTSPAFEAGGAIPRKYTGEGADVSPPLAWEGVPARAKELALICDDPDAPRADPWVHWVLYRIPPGGRGLPEGSNGGATEGHTDSGHAGYGGPMPPRGHGVHHYHFKIYALDQALPLRPDASKKELLQSMEGHVLAEGELVGTYERK
jgi:Raf kinase inhibitor-like YbhB/YbcL family protein